MDKTIIIYFSLTGNTERLAYLAGDFLKGEGRTADYFKLPADRTASFLKNCRDAFTKKITNIKELPDISGYDLVVLGSPIWAWNVAPAVRAFLEQVSLADKKVFIFSTHGGGPGKAMAGFAKKVTDKGGKVIGTYDVADKRISKDFPTLQALLKKLP
ncbi:MAG: NAD(P)H-dependent oxidoreductase [Candidatus Omnitrophica bacterium]|nr:NAD(P)H-dependent oxidoreductase [Candidatus Omnitrophota bacterium]